ncbi:MAG: hypothetical protein RL839_01950 [Gammaproteobacteria bacterium]
MGAVTGVPTTGSLTTPSFSFTLQGTAINGTSGTYTVGIILDEQGSQRRLEIYIPGVSLSFDGGGNLTGSLTTPSVTIYGRDSAGTLTAEVTAANGGSVSFNGNSISFSAADQISFIQAQGGILADITTSINNTGLTYDYTLILANTAGTNYAFEHSDGTDFPATGASEFTLVPGSNADENTALATNGQKLTGTVAFAASGGGGGGGGGSSSGTEAAIESASAETTNLENIVNSGTVDVNTATTLSALSTTTATTATDLAAALSAGTATAAQATTLATTLAKQMAVAETLYDNAKAAARAGTITSSERRQIRSEMKTLFFSSWKSLRTILRALPNTTPTVTEISAFRGQVSTSLNTTRRRLQSLIESFSNLSSNQQVSQTLALIVESEDIVEVRELIPEVALAIDAALDLDGSTLDESFATELAGISQAALELTLDDLALQLGVTASYVDDPTTQALLADNPTLLSRVADLVLVGINETSLDAAATNSALESVGLSTADAANLSSNLAAFVNANEQSIDIGSGTSLLSASLNSVLGASANTDSLTNTLAISQGNNTFNTNVQSVSIAPSAFPAGAFTRSDGSILVVGEGLATTVVPASADIVGLARGINSADAALSISENGTITITGSDFTVAASFGFSGVNSTAPNSASPTFGEPAGNPATTGYFFTVTYGNGVSQNLVPALHNAAAFEIIAASGFSVITDRSTGVITVDGAVRFRPDYFITASNVAEQTFLNNTGDPVAISSASDINGDGVVDYKVISSAGTQILYGMP